MAATAIDALANDFAFAVNDCASSSNSDCTADIIAAGELLALSGVAVNNVIKDCKALNEV